MTDYSVGPAIDRLTVQVRELTGVLKRHFKEMGVPENAIAPESAEVAFEQAMDFLTKLRTKTLEEPLRVHPGIAPLGKNPLADAFEGVELDTGLRVAVVLMGYKEYSDLRQLHGNHFRMEDRVVRLRKGIMGSIWGASIIRNKEIPPGKVYVIAERTDPAGTHLYHAISIIR